MASQIECSRFKQKSVIKSEVTEMLKPCEIHNRMCDVYREVCFSKSMSTNRLKLSLPQRAWVKKTVHRVETYWLSDKLKAPSPAVCKEGDAENLLGYEWTNHYWFSWKKSYPDTRWELLLLCRDAVGIFWSPSRLDFFILCQVRAHLFVHSEVASCIAI